MREHQLAGGIKVLKGPKAQGELLLTLGGEQGHGLHGAQVGLQVGTWAQCRTVRAEWVMCRVSPWVSAILALDT